MKDEYSLEEVQQQKYLAGLQKGLQEGEEKKQLAILAIAKTMLKEGVTHDLIHKTTGVSIETLRHLSKSV